MPSLGLKPLDSLDRPGFDNAPALNAALSHGIVTLPPGVYGVGSTLVLDAAVGASLEGTFGGRLGPDSPNVGTWLVWQGPPGGTLLSISGIKCRVRDLAVACVRGNALGAGIDLETPASYPGVSSQHVFENVTMWGLAGPITSGWVVGQDGKGNNEMHRWGSCSARNCGIGVAVQNGTDQSEAHQFEDVTFSQCGTAFYGVRTSAHFSLCNFSWCGKAFSVPAGSGRPSSFRGCTSEGCKQFLDAWGVYSVTVEDGRIVMNNAAPGFFFKGGKHLSLRRVQLEDAPTQTGFILPTDQVSVEDILFSSPNPFSLDATRSYRLRAAGVRLANGKFYLPDGTYCNHYPYYAAIDTAGPPRQLSDAIASLQPV